MKVTFFLIVFICSFHYRTFSQASKASLQTSNKGATKSAQPEYLEQLKVQKAQIDSRCKNLSSLLVFARVHNSKRLLPIKNGNFPEDVETSFNVLKNNNGRIIYIFESPTSESGDWDISYRSYYDTSGKIFAFERQEHFFNSECTEGAAHELLVKYFDKQGAVISSQYSLRDDQKKALDSKRCSYPYDKPYVISKDLNSYLTRSGVRNIK